MYLILYFRSSSHCLLETSHCLEHLVDTTRPTLITGDFNVCYNGQRNNAVTNGLEGHGFIQLINKPTHIMGGLIDHAYWLDKSKIWEAPSVESYSPYYSDHDTLLVTLKKKPNKDNILNFLR